MMSSEGLIVTLTSGETKRDSPSVVEERERERKLEEIYEDHVAMVYNICYRMFANRADAQDATQDVFLKVYKNLDRFAGRSKLSTWIYRITMNYCIDRMRRKKLKTVELQEWVASPERGHDVRIRLEKAVASLPASYRSVFVLHDIQGFHHAEIAEILGITPGSSKSLLHRSRVILRKKLDGIWRKNDPTPV
jgi:RNA polymerase sigma-70 factor (ECF subfamily)